MPPIRIHSETELRAIGNNLSHTGDYQLACDITIGSSWSPISRGDNIILDGDGHRVGPLRAPLFESLSDATVFELTLDLDIADNEDATGGLARTATRSALQDVSLYGSISGSGAAGALTGTMTDCKVERCQQNASVAGRAGTGGLAGSAARCQFIECRNANNVRALSGEAGGVAGSLLEQGLCQGCVNEGAVSTQGSRCGGIIGQAVTRDNGDAAGSIIIMDCRNQGDVESVADAGGIIGAALGNGVRIESCVNLAAVSSRTTHAGGVCGRADGGVVLSNNKACVKVAAESGCAGGIVGGAEGSVVIQGSTVDGAFVRASVGARRVLGSAPTNRDSIILENNRAASRVRLCGSSGECRDAEPADDENRPNGLNGETYGCPEGLEARECFECVSPETESIDSDWDNALRDMLSGIAGLGLR
ncbi:MAG: hypothetical protein LBH66_01760 [Oscillospiraceae bacterium]|jgi:hypothetical protein|nr:hypothetical protein [Oscillospiraceae bacterium]